LRKLIGIRNGYFSKKEIVRLEYEIVICEIAFGMVHGPPYEGFPKNPLAQGMSQGHIPHMFSPRALLDVIY
jgi:hypothetical protein